MEIIVKPAEVGGDFATLVGVEGGVHLEDDGLGALDVVVDGEIEFEGIFVVEAHETLLEEANGAFIEHEDELSGRGGLGGNFAVGLPGV